MKITNVVLLVELDNTTELRTLILTPENKNLLLQMTSSGMFSDEVVKLEDTITAHLLPLEYDDETQKI